MLIGSINFSLIYFLIKGQFRKFFFDEELRWFLGIILLAAVTVAMVLFIHPAIDIRLKDAFRVAIFQVISVISTTGFYTGDYIQWGTFFWILFLFLMVICGCSGSTSGGMKTVRALVLVKNMRCEFNRLLHPRAIISVRLNGRVLSLEVVQRLMAFVFLYIFIIVFSWGIFVLAGVPFAEALGASVTSIGNVGPGFGVYGPASSFADIPSFVKIYMSLLMIVGRLEIFTVLILFTSEFWKK
jgi:trk system potassium uptake protein TrkH